MKKEKYFSFSKFRQRLTIAVIIVTVVVVVIVAIVVVVVVTCAKLNSLFILSSTNWYLKTKVEAVQQRTSLLHLRKVFSSILTAI